MSSPNTVPRFVETPRIAAVEISTANTNRDGTGTLGTVLTGGTNGSRIDLIRIVAEGTTTAGVVRLFLHDGSTFFLYEEILVDAITPSTTQEVFRFDCQPADAIVLPSSSWTLQASTHNAETFNVFAHAGDY